VEDPRRQASTLRTPGEKSGPAFKAYNGFDLRSGDLSEVAGRRLVSDEYEAESEAF
jgi:hypothetical protein